MKGKAGSQDLLRLEIIFTYSRNRDSISVIREQVENYERSIKKQAEEIEQTSIRKGNKKKVK